MKKQAKSKIFICAILVLSLLVCILLCGRTPLKYNDWSGLSELMRRDFSDVQIIDAVFEYEDGGTHVCLFLKEDAERNVRYSSIIKMPGKAESLTDLIPPEDIEIFEKCAVKLEDIIGFDESHGEVKVGFSEASFVVRWYQIEDSVEKDFNAVLVSYIPRVIIMKQ